MSVAPLKYKITKLCATVEVGEFLVTGITVGCLMVAPAEGVPHKQWRHQRAEETPQEPDPGK